MDISQFTGLIRQDATPVVFANVLLEQLGLPLPAVPILLLAGSLAATPAGLGKVLLATVLASVIADWCWFQMGKRYGYRVLSGLCLLSINPATCVRDTEGRFVRWGVSSLIIAKFVPGFSIVAPPIAGALNMRRSGFLLASAIGAGLWGSVAIGAGCLLKDAVRPALVLLDQQSGYALILVLFAFGAWLGWKLWHKYQFRKFRSNVRFVEPDELVAAMAADEPPLLLDMRGPTMIAATGVAKGATATEQTSLLAMVADWPRERPIVTLCACPEDASAVMAASQLLKAGYLSVKALRGGYDAWLTANDLEDGV